MRDLLPKIQSNDGQFHNGNPATGEQGTRVTDTWLNDVQEHIRDFGDEFKYLLQQVELEPDPEKKTQIYDAIEQIIENKRRAASLTKSGEVELDSSTDSTAEDKAATPKAVNAVKALVTAVRNALNNYIPNSKKSNDDNSISSDTVATSYAVKKVRDIATKKATDTVAGQTVLSHKINGTDKSKAASEFALGELNKEIATKGLPVGSVMGFVNGYRPNGYLLANGSRFDPQTYPDLYIANGNSDVLPNVNLSNIGMTSFFFTDDIPAGWIPVDTIQDVVTSSSYPELYKYLIEKYGNLSNVPRVEDRYVRNAGDNLNVGQVQGDAIRNITGEIDLTTLGGGNQFLEFSAEYNEQVFKGALAPQPSKWSRWSHDQDNGTHVPRGFKFDASRVVPTANENRPKTLVLKFCIKAQDILDGIRFWVKAFGVVENTGSMDAGRLAQSIQSVRAEKADIEHTHSYVDIIDFKTGVANAYQHLLQEHGWRKNPDGFIEQWGKTVLNPGSGNGTENPINFPITFPNQVLNVVMSYALMTDKRITQDPVLSALSETGMTIRQQSDRNVIVYWRAIGR